MRTDLILQRIGYCGPVEPTLPVLRSLLLGFLFSVPFENLDIIQGKEIFLDPEAIFEKIVRRKRGGVCFERNILFHELLAALGYTVDYLSARMVKATGIGPEYDHMALLVRLDHGLLVDAGNGHFCRHPLCIDGSDQASSEGYAYRVGRQGTEHAFFLRKERSDWIPKFLFNEQPRRLAEFEEMNRFHQGSANSRFNRNGLITLATTGGRVSLIGRRLIITSPEGTLSRELETDEAYLQGLEHYFGIVSDGVAEYAHER
jgi:N-hydroxyarylamine O-acetyltransferase